MWSACHKKIYLTNLEVRNLKSEFSCLCPVWLSQFCLFWKKMGRGFVNIPKFVNSTHNKYLFLWHADHISVEFWIFIICMFLNVTEFWNLGHLQSIISVPQLKRYNFEWVGLLSDLILMSAEKKIKTNIQNSTIDSSFDALSKWHDPYKIFSLYLYYTEHLTSNWQPLQLLHNKFVSYLPSKRPRKPWIEKSW